MARRSARPAAAAALWTAAAAALASMNAPAVRAFGASGGPQAAFLSVPRGETFRRPRASSSSSSSSSPSSSTALPMSSASEMLRRRSVTIPLIDLSAESDSSLMDKTIVPLPSAHLPRELSTLNVYGFEVTAPVHRMMVENALGRGDPAAGEVSGLESCYGHIVQTNASANEEGVHGLVGAIGCAAEVLLAGDVVREPPQPQQPPPASPERAEQPPEGRARAEAGGEGSRGEATNEEEAAAAAGAGAEKEKKIEDLGPGELSGEPPLLVLARGSYRFVVREIVQTFPYPVGVVDELLDEEPVAPVRAEEEDDDEEEEDWDEDEDDDDEEEEDEDWYLELTPAELVQRTLRTMKALVEQRLNTREKEPTPLEMAIMEDAGVPIQSAAAKRTQAEEMAAVLDVFSSDLLDFAPLPLDRYYAIGMLGAEMADVGNDLRRRILATRDGAERLRIVLRELDRKISEAATKKLTEEIGEKTGEGSGSGPQDLKVGAPEIPAWAGQIKKGTKVEYFWNEEWGWCGGVVSEEPTMVVDELIVTVTFDADGTVHRLPFTGEEKARWRPG